MAYGLDFEEIYYTDTYRNDLGVLQTYSIDVDLALEKDFRIQSPEPVIPMKGFWYIQGTEYGGIIDRFETDSDESQIIYGGRTFRGLLASHIVDVDGLQRVIPANVKAVVNEEGASLELTEATITNCMNELLEESGLGGCFVVDEPEAEGSVDITLQNYTVKQGTSLYDALVGMARSIDFTFVLRYESDHMVHITPVLIQDYTDYLKGSKYDGLGFRTELDTATYNHLIVCAVNEDRTSVRIAHFFADRNGGIQPYKTVDEPIKDSQYIVDKRGQVLFGTDEVTEYMEVTESADENYELVTAAPKNWRKRFGEYYRHEFTDSYNQVTAPTGNPKAQGWYEKSGDNYVLTNDTSVELGKAYYTLSVSESWNPYEAVGSESWKRVTRKPSGWNTVYSNYYHRHQDQSGGWNYTAYTANSAPDENHAKRVTKKPKDWKSNYSEYYYKVYETAQSPHFEQYSGRQKSKFRRLTKKPIDWDTNFGSYYRKVFKSEMKKRGKRVVPVVDYVIGAYDKAYYTTCKPDDDGKNKTRPKFSARAHYVQETFEVVPTWNSNNCYKLKNVETPPEWMSDNCYMQKEVYKAPKFVHGEVYRMVLDHYADMVEAAVDFFENEKKKSSQEMDLDYFSVNIGDIIGGTDEFTSTTVTGSVSNIEAKIENGMIDLYYKINIEDYTSALVSTEE